MPTKENRGYIVWGIIMGGLFGFLINVFSTVFYEIFIVKSLLWENVDHRYFSLCAIALVGLIGYLLFFIFDYPNTPEFSKVYFRRFISYFFKSFWPGKVARLIIGIYLLVLLVGFLVVLYYFMAQRTGYSIATIFFVFVIVAGYFKDKREHGR